ncbi:type I-E CRISPR-associated protein Cas5/CasD [Arcanobacterium pinnipediorum]|uniref:Type I-E CRISPR-associated protein Cas5/CasD n=1 Tax=Arcanobacterium pinnipediorum TaxID=1503041 RepID=A0ABY5AGL7_9ACTO|nr:type I-E CRISPR-associated protein Cas5/CasD [Arcanobacterium pinnipediorum]USR79353.1 type I-E CRISPR-associated protein Cas5/CasD [Arcanobacterium pinnipediorum]
MIESLYIRLSAPIQSWAGPAVSGNIVRTESWPTRSGLLGLLAGALGAERGKWPDWLNDVEFVVRQDRRPNIVDDFHTINPRTESILFRRRHLIVQGASAGKAKGKALVFTPDAQGGTSVVNRTYLADGEFLVRITSDHIDELENALASPGFATYLGRKAFAPDFPFYLGRGSADLIEKIPVFLNESSKRLDEDDAQKSKPLAMVIYGKFHPEKGRRQQQLIPVVKSRSTQFDFISENLDIRRIPE